MDRHHHIWDEKAAKMLSRKEREFEENKSCLKEVFGTKKERIVDLGCGSSFYAKELKKFASLLYCIDSSEAMLSEARKNIRGRAVKFINADSSDTTLEDSSVDAVFMANAFHDMDKYKTSKEVIRILKPKGRIIIIDWKKSAKIQELPRRGPPEGLRMSEEEYLEWFPGFRISKRFEVGKAHFGIVLSRQIHLTRLDNFAIPLYSINLEALSNL